MATMPDIRIGDRVRIVRQDSTPGQVGTVLRCFPWRPAPYHVQVDGWPEELGGIAYTREELEVVDHTRTLCPFCPLMSLDRAEPVATDSDGLPVLIAGIGSCADCALIADVFDTVPFLIQQLAAPIATFFDGLCDLLIKCEWYVGEEMFAPLTHFETDWHGVNFDVGAPRVLHVHVLDCMDNHWEYMEVSHA
jgi:hypothetical protein